MIANELCSLKLDKLQLMKYALEIENHPDNLSAALFGGFVVSCVDSNGDCRAFSTEVSQYPLSYYLLFIIYYLLFIIYYLLFIIYYLLFIIYYLFIYFYIFIFLYFYIFIFLYFYIFIFLYFYIFIFLYFYIFIFYLTV